MTDTYTIEFATPADDAAIRRLLKANPVPGAVTVTYEREPCYFLGCATMGPFCQVAVCRQQPGGAVVGLSCRAARPMFVNGQADEVGYLGQLRIDAAHQGRWLLSRAFQHLREWHRDGRVAGYITTIIEDNAIAEGVLVKRARRHFPVYRELDRLCTLALVVTRLPWLRRRVCPTTAEYTISRGSYAELGEIVAFLRQCGAARQFFPVYNETDFCDNPVTRDFQVSDFVVARRDGAIVGVLGLWDQAHYKQTVIHSYHGSLRRLRPAYNLGARLVGAQPLPRSGEHLRYAYASFCCVQQDNPAIFAALLWHVYRMAAERGYSYLMLGLMTSDPLLAVARRYPHISYYSRMYTVDWPDEPHTGLHARLDERVPFIELATL
jgi:GNAT superfamily N-acetyltransferase